MTQEERMEFKEIIEEALSGANFATKDDMKNFATKDDLKNFATKDDIARLDNRIDGIEKYMHDKFLLMENDMMPKIDAMYEALTTRVSHEECDKRMKGIEEKTDAIDPIMLTVENHSAKIFEHEERLEKLEALAF